MFYPESPFGENATIRILTSVNGNEVNVDQQSIRIQKETVEKTLKWLCTAPKISSYRVNTLKIDTPKVLKDIQGRLDQILGVDVVNAHCIDSIPDTIVIKNLAINKKLNKYDKEIVIDIHCGAAVLRGAHIYAPGVMGMVAGVKVDDKVSIYVDTRKKCKKGLQKIYCDEGKLFIGNGTVRMTRSELFGENLNPSGIAVEVAETISGCPSIGGDFLPVGWALLQNIPSIVCVYNLNPQEGEIILDMCASPGNKTTHIAALMKNKGTLVAIDKTPNKLKQLEKKSRDFGANVACYQADSTKITNPDTSPLFPLESFDRILLDAPCSALGKRPQFSNTTSEKVLRSYIPLQRKLFESAVNLLKCGGTLVYSTCTITLSENEGLVAWALKTFRNMQLIKPKVYVGGPGWLGTTLTEAQRHMVQRFGPDQEDLLDSVGFFIACFVKKQVENT